MPAPMMVIFFMRFPECNGGYLRVSNTLKHACVAARIGEGKAPGEGNSY